MDEANHLQQFHDSFLSRIDGFPLSREHKSEIAGIATDEASKTFMDKATPHLQAREESTGSGLTYQ
jgi:hypothetical protein